MNLKRIIDNLRISDVSSEFLANASRVAKDKGRGAQSQRLAKGASEKLYSELKNYKDEIPEVEVEDKSTDGYVDLGLPSGTLWADRNVEANTPKDNGGYFTFKEAQKKGIVPSEEQFQELIEECKWNWKGNGYEVVGPNGNSIFLPAAGYRDGSDVYYVGSNGYYWSSSVFYDSGAYCLYFISDDAYVYDDGRSNGQSVRLVK